MSNSDGKFRHESLQNRKTIKALLEAVTKGIAKGELTLNDDGNELTLVPDGLLTLRIKADKADGNCRLDLRLSWSEESATPQNKKAPKIA
ncbi:amphi-Trp domain-containing protein [Rhodobacteraceae bacterium NNCM2]|nr:amphi-Trp domain-containing protein [Coraliihabitans acroporae]